jgi:hypothetical protein
MGKVKLKQSTPRAVKNQLRHSGALSSANAGGTAAIETVFTARTSPKNLYQNRYSFPKNLPEQFAYISSECHR